MKRRKITKKEHKTKISLITLALMGITVGILVAAVMASINNRESFLRAMINRFNETNNSVVAAELAKEVNLEVASTVATSAGRISLNVKTNSTNPNTFKEYRYYIKKSTDDIYVLDAIKVEEQHAYIKLNPATEYDVKVEAVCYSGNTMVSTATGETPTIY